MGALIVRTLLVVVGFLLGGCSPASPVPTTSASPSPAPDYVWTLAGAEWPERRLFVYDDAELLTGIRSVPDLTFADDNIWWSPIPSESDSLVLGWIGGVCANPTLRISQEGSAVTLAVSEGVFEGVEPEACPAVGVVYEVVLTFRVPVTDLVIGLRLSG